MGSSNTIMLQGFNHNIRYKGVLFHVQTEDGGLSHPFVTTQVFYGGNVLASRRRSYEKFVKSPGVSDLVLSTMKDQHKEMMKDLVNGRLRSVLILLEEMGVAPKVAAPALAPRPPSAPRPVQPTPAPARRPAGPPVAVRPVAARPPASALRTFEVKEKEDRTLDELILEFLEEETRSR